jgi:hypothetical protein
MTKGYHPMLSLAPALSIQQVDDNLRKLRVTGRDILALLNDPELSSIVHKSRQVCFTQRYFYQTLHHELTTNQLAVLFELNPRTSPKYRLRGPQDAQMPSRHRALDAASESELTTMIIQAFNEGKAMTKRQVIELVRERYSAGLTKGWLNTFVGHHLDALQIYGSLPQEDIRLTIPRDNIEAHIEHMKSIVAGKFAELVLNLDEVRSSDWEDRKP